MTSFKGRTGAVTPASGDYSVSQVTGAAPKSSPVFTSDISLGRKENTKKGLNSIAFGYNVEASGYCSFARGAGAIASGDYSHADGSSTTASGDYSHAAGFHTTASGKFSHAEGTNTSASGEAAHAEGSHTNASGEHSHAEGAQTKALAKWSHVEGYNTSTPNETDLAAHAEGGNTTASNSFAHAEGTHTTASGAYAHAEGDWTVASGSASHAGGKGTIANQEALTAIGIANIEGKYFDDLFIIGKGSFNDVTGVASTRANCFRVTRSGVYASGSYSASGADYAELFEWADGNLERMDRVGRFVTLEGDHIRLAGPGDDYILGIVSGAPSVVGDVYDDQWQGMYLTDIFGRPIMEDVEVPAVTEEVPDPEDPENTVTQTIIPAHTERRQKLNPDYDNSLTYVPRTERPEWAAVGMLGKLVAVDDGTCVPNGWATVGEGGAATASQERTKYRCMARLDEAHVRILIL